MGRLLENVPDLTARPITPDTYLWLGHGVALVKQIEPHEMDVIKLEGAVDNLGGKYLGADAPHTIMAILFRAMAIAEGYAPPGVSGMFIPVGNALDAFASVAKVLRTATRDVLLIDPYMDEVALTEFGTAVPEGISFRLLADGADHKSTLLPAAKKWIVQYGAKRPLEVRLAPNKTLHDRAILVDGSTAWTLTQSLKDFARRSPAEIVRADDVAPLKIAAYEEIWAKATRLV